MVTRLRYFFDYLEDKDMVISSDAYNEFARRRLQGGQRSRQEDSRPRRIIKWLKDPNTRGSRFGLYGLLLGHCGKPDRRQGHPRTARRPGALLHQRPRRRAGRLHHARPQGRLGLPRHSSSRAKSEFPVQVRRSPDRAVLLGVPPDLIPHKQVLEAMKMLMEQPDIADMPIEDLRKWKVWDLTPLVLGYADKDTHNTIPIINRAILKFAIAASWADPKNTAAAEFVAEGPKKKDARRVEFLEELLKDEVKPHRSQAGHPREERQVTFRKGPGIGYARGRPLGRPSCLPRVRDVPFHSVSSRDSSQPAPLAAACTFCGGNIRAQQTLRMHYAAAKAVLHGQLKNPRFDPQDRRRLHRPAHHTALKDDPARGGQRGPRAPHLSAGDRQHAARITWSSAAWRTVSSTRPSACRRRPRSSTT